MDLGLSGLVSGLDWRSLVDQLGDVERLPQRRLLTEQTQIRQRNTAYGSIQTQLSLLQKRIQALKEPAFFNARSVSTSDATIASATATTDASLGSYRISITHLATTAKQIGASNIGAALSASADVSSVVLSSAPMATTISAGTFTVSGKQVTIATSDTLQDVFDKIAAATGGAVTAAYDPGADKIVVSGSAEIVLGSATDTSNFLQAARLYNNGTASVTSAAALGTIQQSGSLASANFSTAISDGGSGAGQFKINGVAITFSTADSVSSVLARINDANAGVTASYDVVNDRISLTNKSTGDVGIAVEDVTGNFLTATGILSGALQRGDNLVYTVDDGPELTSLSNSITETSSGIAGLTVNALMEGTAVVTVASDTAALKTAISDFITEYNKAQSLIDTQTSSSTDANGKVTAAVLANEPEASEIGSRLRALSNGEVTGLATALKALDALGIVSNGTDNTLKIDDEAKLDAALATSLPSVIALFTDETNGIATRLDAFLEKTVGDDGSLLAKQDKLTKDAASIDTQVAELERVVQANRERMIASFVAMETAQANINQQLQFLQQRFSQQ